MDKNKQIITEEKVIRPKSGWAMLFLSLLLYVVFAGGLIGGIILCENGSIPLGVPSIIAGCVAFIAAVIIDCGLKIMKPNEALVLTLFGKYIGTLKNDGFFFVNPFSTAVNPNYDKAVAAANEKAKSATDIAVVTVGGSKKISLKAMTLRNEKQKINDVLGNPIEIGINVIWNVENTAMAVFNVDNYTDFLSAQADSALRNIVRLYPYDVSDEGDEKSLRGSSQEIAESLRGELHEKVKMAGLNVSEVRITHLAYAPEIAAAMLQRQQATAIIEARQKIVEGAVGMVDMALKNLSENNVCDLDEERKAQMVSNLLVVLCGNKDAQPIVNSGSIY